MTNLFKQLEDKKKGCGTMITIGLEYSHCGFRNTFFCDNCKSNIAILEQAIAEIEKRDKEEIEWIEGKIKLFKEIHSLSGIHIELGFLDRIEQLQSQQTSKEIVSSSELANADISNLLQKQRQEEIEWLNKYFIYAPKGTKIYDVLKKRIKQLNQPKTENGD